MVNNSPTEEQKKVIETIDKPILVTAGPGTGKTYALVERILYIIESKKANPDEILVITYTNKAAKELLTRISKRFKDRNLKDINLEDMYISTFHSFCQRLINEKYEKCPWLSKNYRGLEEFEQIEFISKYINTDKVTYKNGATSVTATDFCAIDGSREVIAAYLHDTDFSYKGGIISKRRAAKAVCGLCDKLIEELVDTELLSEQSDKRLSAAGKMVAKYQKLLSDNDYIVFSTLLKNAYDMIKNDDENGEIRNKFKYIMVDEYQDTNRIQDEMIDMLGGRNKNICVVGDDDQSLYRFRGATVENILSFFDKYSSYGCEKFELSKNFRSTDEIVSFYTKWIKNPQGFRWGKCRLDKNLSAVKSSQTNTVARLKGNDEGQWYKAVYSFIKNLKSSGKITDYNQIAFLSKSVRSKNILGLQKYLSENGIPVYSPRSGLFFERDEIQCAVGCLLLMFPDAKAFVMKCNRDYSSYCDNSVKKAKELTAKNDALKSFIDDISKDKSCCLTFKEILYRLLAFEPFSYWADVNIDSSMDITRPAHNLSILIKLCGMYEKTQKANSKKITHKDAAFFFGAFLNSQFGDGVMEFEDEREYAPKGYVSFMTIHQSKGLEFPIVIVDSLTRFANKKSGMSFTDTIISSQYSNFLEPNEDKNYFDFWREYNTAFSRAQNLLVLTGCSQPNKIFDKIWDGLPDVSKSLPDLSKIDFEEVKSADFNDSFSYTADIAPYETCPKRYKLTKMFGFETSKSDTAGTLFGSLVHQTLQDIHHEAIKQKEITKDKIDKWLNENADSLERSKNVNMKPVLENAKKQVMNYYEYLCKNYSDKYRWSSIKNAEMKVSISGENFIMNGTIDMVREYPKFYRIFDFKSGTKDEKNMPSYYRQLRIYAYMLGCVSEEKEVSMQLFFTGEEKNPIETLEFDNEKDNIKKEAKRFTETVNKILNHDFSSQCEDVKICKECDFRFLCKKCSVKNQ